MLRGQRAAGFLSAYAEPIGHDAERVFYFSKQDGSVELAVPASGSRASECPVRMPAVQGQGRYRVYAVVADRPLAREELVRGAGQQGNAKVTSTSDYATSGARGGSLNPPLGDGSYVLQFPKASPRRGFRYACGVHGKEMLGVVHVG